MDDQRFDRVAIQLGRVMTRRHMGSLLAMLGLGASSGSTPEATAKNKNNKNKKKKQKPKKPPSCTPLCVGQACGDPDGCGGACQDGFCPGTQICDDGVCKDDCPSPQKLCSGGCVALDTNSNCGDCDIACPEHASCTDGQCVCNDGARPCGDECIADANCCTDEAPGCPHDRTCCLEGEQGVCRNTNADENNCGGCGPVFACDGDHQCVDGDCQPICAPECASGRTCIADPRSGDGTCTCTTHEQCRAERNPGGEDCIYANGNSGAKICRCTMTSWYGSHEPEEDTPCAPGEPCSNCCTNQYCRDVYAESPGSMSYICTLPPVDSYWPRFCCKPNWAPCINGGTGNCCSGDCLQAGYDDETGAPEYRCLCSPPGNSCATDIECCRGKCHVTTDAFGQTTGECLCFPIEHECTEDSECCSQHCDVTTQKCACEQEPCECKLPMARCEEDSECCRGVCKDSNLCA